MISTSFFRRHFLLTALVFAVILTISSQLAHFVSHLDRTDFFHSQGGRYVEVLKQHAKDGPAYLKQINKLNHELGMSTELDLIRDGRSLLSGEDKDIPDSSNPDTRSFTSEMEVDGEPATFVMTINNPRSMSHRGYWITLGAMFLAILIATGLSLMLQFWSIRDKAELAKTVLRRMQGGDLKARFPTTRLDEVGHLMALFNQMADEIERLVARLQQNEKHRLHLLQDLAHDLRTPVSSLRNLVEALHEDGGRLSEQQRKEVSGLAYQETEYLTRLVEDLLFLAFVIEPKYKPESDQLAIGDILRIGVEAVGSTYPAVKGEIQDRAPGAVMAGGGRLIERLMRNALQNAFSFAKSRVEVEISQEEGVLNVSIRDDGPGLTKEQLEGFGKKRSTRIQAAGDNGRISVGLGSVIIQAIAAAHGGSASIRNMTDARGAIRGAELVVRLRVSDPTVAA